MRGLIKIFLAGLAIVAIVIVALPIILDPYESPEDEARRPVVVAAIVARSLGTCNVSQISVLPFRMVLERGMSNVRTAVLSDIHEWGITLCPDIDLAEQKVYGLSRTVMGIYYPARHILTLNWFEPKYGRLFPKYLELRGGTILRKLHREYRTSEFTELQNGNEPVYAVTAHRKREQRVYFRTAHRLGLELSRNESLGSDFYSAQ